MLRTNFVTVGNTIIIPLAGVNHNWSAGEGVSLIGENPDIDTGTTPEDVWPYGGAYTFASAAATLFISSSSAADTAVTVTAQGLTSAYAEQTETGVSLDAIDAQTKTEIGTGLTWLRTNDAFVDGDTAAVGTIYIYEDDTVVAGVPQTASKIRAIIEPAVQRTRQIIYTIPANKTGYILAKTVGTAGAAKSDVHADLQTRLLNGVFTGRNNTALLAAGTSIDRHRLAIAEAVPEKTDLRFRVTEVTVDNAHVDAAVEMLILPNI